MKKVIFWPTAALLLIGILALFSATWYYHKKLPLAARKLDFRMPISTTFEIPVDDIVEDHSHVISKWRNSNVIKIYRISRPSNFDTQYQTMTTEIRTFFEANAAKPIGPFPKHDHLIPSGFAERNGVFWELLYYIEPTTDELIIVMQFIERKKTPDWLILW